MSHTTGIIFRTAGPWGDGKGSNLTPAEFDENNYDLDERLVFLELNPPVPVEISNITVTGSSMTFHMDDSSTFGPFTLPVATFKWVGTWAPLTQYFENDVFFEPGDGVYLVTADFESATAFDPGGAEIEKMLPAAARWYTGSGAPDGGLGNEGDLYLDTAGGDVYEHQGTAGWVQVDNLTGPQGPAGADGTTIDTLDDVPDVEYGTAGPAEADVLVRRSGQWEPEAQSGAPGSLDEVGDVDYPTGGPADGDHLIYRSSTAGSAWGPEVFAGGGGAGTGAFPSRGALVRSTGTQSILNATDTAVDFDAEERDTDDIHDNSTNNTRLSVPPGWTAVKLAACIAFASNGNGERTVKVTKNGSSFLGMPYQLIPAVAFSDILSVNSADSVPVVGGTDYFEVEVKQSSGGALDVVNGDTTWFSMERVESGETGLSATVQTTDATQTVLASGALAADSAHTIRAVGHGREAATGDTYHFEIFAGARNEGGTSSAPTPDVTEVADAGASTWDATLVANDGTDEWEIKVTGEAAHTIDWTVTWFEIVTQP